MVSTMTALAHPCPSSPDPGQMHLSATSQLPTAGLRQVALHGARGATEEPGDGDAGGVARALLARLPYRARVHRALAVRNRTTSGRGKAHPRVAYSLEHGPLRWSGSPRQGLPDDLPGSGEGACDPIVILLLRWALVAGKERRHRL